MDTNRIKRFATEARNILKAGIAAKIVTLGFNRKGEVPEQYRPQLLQSGSLWNGQLMTESFYHQWMSLFNRIQQKGIDEVYEEAAYTWFNRLCAIRILQKNNLCAAVLAYSDGARTPVIVDEARQGRMPDMDETMRSRLNNLLDDDTKVTEQFAVLINAWCHNNPIISQCFGSMADYTELLLPNNILAEGGFVDMLNHTEFITDEDYQSPELIGWLYQFYISERKDEVFAKKGKFEADEIPAATQIFTPNWIVKYMVQNTVGRIYLDNNPYETQLQKRWRYLVEPAEKAAEDSILTYEELTDLKVADLACGSGHILNECFDLLYDLYIAEGYGRGEAIENIFRHNLTGVDIDTRAKQLATFALLMKACQKDAGFADGHCMPRVMDMPKVDRYSFKDTYGHFDCAYGLASDEKIYKELVEAFTLLEDAENLGSIMKFYISENTRAYMIKCREVYADNPQFTDAFDALMRGYALILALTDRYHALVMNPPYMGGGNMNATLSKYVKENYEEGKADLFSVFMLLAIDRLKANGKYGMINMHSWMFLSSFEYLRSDIVNNRNIDSLLHLGTRTFDELSGEVVQNAAFVITNKKIIGFKGNYYRLIDGRNCSEKELLFLKGSTKFSDVEQSQFLKITGTPIGYWLKSSSIDLFLKQKIGDKGYSRRGLQPGSVPLVVRRWFEVNQVRIDLSSNNRTSALSSNKKWYKLDSGGGPRKWFGNYDSIVDWENNGYTIKHLPNPIVPSEHLYFLDGVVWSKISSRFPTFRYHEGGIIPGDASPCFFSDKNNKYRIMAFLNSCVSNYFLKLLAPTLNLKTSDIDSLPYIEGNELKIQNMTNECLNIARNDWNAHETSWDFEENPLLAVDTETYIDNIHHEIERHEKETGEHLCIDPAAPELDSLEWRMEQYKKKWEHLFLQLHSNEEELNRQFIEIYGLQDELTPDVPLDEITILQQGEINIVPASDDGSIHGSTMEWNDDVVMKQFISYAVGYMMGRYRLDKKGLHIAHPEPTAEETVPYLYNNMQFEIDEDGIIPLMPGDCGFADNASNRFAEFLRIALGDSKHVENLNFVEKCLGKTLEQYFVKDFWKDHKKMYQNRPIYWLFASKKGAFQCITYMHRMNAYTVERIRAKYLLPYIENLQARIIDLEARRASLSTRETKQLQQLCKTLEECQEYHERLQVVAEQAISFDLDDGVVVNYAKFGDVVQKIK